MQGQSSAPRSGASVLYRFVCESVASIAGNELEVVGQYDDFTVAYLRDKATALAVAVKFAEAAEAPHPAVLSADMVDAIREQRGHLARYVEDIAKGTVDDDGDGLYGPALALADEILETTAGPITVDVPEGIRDAVRACALDAVNYRLEALEASTAKRSAGGGAEDDWTEMRAAWRADRACVDAQIALADRLDALDAFDGTLRLVGPDVGLFANVVNDVIHTTHGVLGGHDTRSAEALRLTRQLALLTEILHELPR